MKYPTTILIGVVLISGSIAGGPNQGLPSVWADRVGDLPVETAPESSEPAAIGTAVAESQDKPPADEIAPPPIVPSEAEIGPAADSEPLDPKAGVAVEDCAVRFAEELNIPSTEAGLIAEMNVTIGQPIAAGNRIARLDDRSLKIRSRAAQLRLTAAEQQISDDLELRYAETARAEAIAEWEASRSIYNESSGAVPLSNLRRLKLGVERAELEVARAQKAAKQAQIEIDLRSADVAMIDDTMRRLTLTSPITGVVLQVFKQRGEWVASGEAVVRLARLDRLQVQALMSADQCSPNACLNQPVSVSWNDPINGKKHYLRGRVNAVQPQRLAGGRYRIQAEIVNSRGAGGTDWLLHPGTEVEMVVYPPRGLSAATARRTDTPLGR